MFNLPFDVECHFHWILNAMIFGNVHLHTHTHTFMHQILAASATKASFRLRFLTERQTAYLLSAMNDCYQPHTHTHG